MIGDHFPILFRRYSCFTLSLSENLKILPTGGLRLLLIFSVLPIAQYLGAYYDNALVLPDDARGLLEHPGQWAIFFAPPLLILLAGLAFRSLLLAIKCLPSLCPDYVLPPSVTETIRQQEESFSLRRKEKTLLALLMLIGAFVALRNFIQTSDATRYYGNDIFDSSLHFWGFTFTRINNCVLYTLIFPLLLFQIFLISLSSHKILAAMVRENSLSVDFFNSDSCGGLSRFGHINMLIMLMWAVIFAVIYAHFVTHKQTALTLNISLVAASALFVVQSLWGVHSIYRCVKKKKAEVLKELNFRLNLVLQTRQDLHIVTPLMQLRSAVAGTNAFPYTKATLAVVNVLRFTPPLIALLNLRP